MSPVVHAATHVLTGASIYAAGRTWHKARRQAWLGVAAASTYSLHRHHHPRHRRTP